MGTGRYTVSYDDEWILVIDSSVRPRRVFVVGRDGVPRFRGRPIVNLRVRDLESQIEEWLAKRVPLSASRDAQGRVSQVSHWP
jgi:hypothetical protein